MGKKLMMLLLGAFTCLLVNAQVKTVTGHVTSADNGEPLIGVSVSVPGTTIGVNTDADGRFTLSNLPASAKQLRFSFIGMEAQVLPGKKRDECFTQIQRQNAWRRCCNRAWH